jgi:hypothetical protein
MAEELLSPVLLIAVIATLVVAIFLVWTILSFTASQRRIAGSLEALVRRLDLAEEIRNPDKEWVIEEPSRGKLKNSISAGPGKANGESVSLKPAGSAGQSPTGKPSGLC